MNSKQQLGGGIFNPYTWFGNSTAINNENTIQKAELIKTKKEQETIRDAAIAKIASLDSQIKKYGGGTKSRKPNKKYSRKNH